MSTLTMSVSTRRWIFRFGLVLILSGVGVLGYVGWEYIGTNIVAQRAQADQLDQLRQRWSDGSDSADSGEAGAILRIPRFGSDYEVPIIQGVDDDDLSSGVGHQPGTAGPGEVGNYVLAGHRVTHGEPFAEFPDLRRGDLIEVVTRSRTFTYRLAMGGNDLEVGFDEGWVMSKRPDYPAIGKSRRLITLVTCAELFHTSQRLVAFGNLIDVEKRSGG